MNSSLFSHAPHEPEPPKSADPVHCRVTVPRESQEAFSGFTDLIHLWWPVDRQSVAGEGSHVEFEDHVLTETTLDDEVHVWGEILEWTPGSHLRCTWHPGTGLGASGEVDVDFVDVGDGNTEVRLTHSGWENMPEGGRERAAYADGWPQVLGHYVRFMGGTA